MFIHKFTQTNTDTHTHGASHIIFTMYFFRVDRKQIVSIENHYTHVMVCALEKFIQFKYAYAHYIL